MNLSTFLRLVKHGEKETVDFKIRCDAFLSARAIDKRQAEAAKVELAKDICAMANNGNRASYLIIGVSDDRRQAQSVSNDALTDENVQNLCRTSITPIPKVSVKRVSWPEAEGEYAGKEFVIMQIGPQARQAFGLARDLVVPERNIHYRKNQVWLRRGSTSDTASPTEVARLQRGQSWEGAVSTDSTVDYTKLPKAKQPAALLSDLKQCIEEIGGSMYELGNYAPKVVFRLGRTRYVWRCVVLERATARGELSRLISEVWGYDHGILFLVMDTVSEQALPPTKDLQRRESWRWFTNIEQFDRLAPASLVPYVSGEFSLVVITLSKLKSTESLRQSFLTMKRFLDEEESARDRVQQARRSINNNLSYWLKRGFIFVGERLNPSDAVGTNSTLIRTKNPTSPASIDGRKVILELRDQQLRKDAGVILDLAGIKVPHGPIFVPGD